MQSSEHEVEWEKINDKASAVALCTESPDVVGVLIEVGAEGVYEKAQCFKAYAPSERSEENARIFDDAKRNGPANKNSKSSSWGRYVKAQAYKKNWS
jgi:hypothetical protein